MPVWLPLALLAPLLFAAVNHIDKHLIEKYFKRGEIGSLVIFSSLAGLPIALLIIAFHPSVFTIPPIHASLLILSGILYICGAIPYFYALSKDETTIVAPLFQLVPVISFILAYIFLKESITLIQFLGSLLITGGAVALSLELGAQEHQTFKIKWPIISLMALSSLLIAMDRLLFKFVAVQDLSFWTSAFWGYLGYLTTAVWLLIFIPPYRRQFLQVIEQNKLPVLTLNLLNEILNVTGETALHYATLFAPLAIIVWLSEGFQPFFILVLGILITKLWPNLGQENLTRRHLTHKLLAITIMLTGTYLISK